LTVGVAQLKALGNRAADAAGEIICLIDPVPGDLSAPR